LIEGLTGSIEFAGRQPKGTSMILDVASRRLAALVCTAVSLSLASFDRAAAAPLAAELGPLLPRAEISGGYVGRLKVMPERLARRSR
jgi:hypothetical protein